MSVERCPRCARCGRLIIGPLAIDAAAVPGVGWVCGEDATIEERQAYLRRLLENASAW